MTGYRSREARTKILIVLYLTALAIFLGVANSQIYDFGVQTSTDEFTGVQSCWQRVDNNLRDDSGITLSYITDTDLGTVVWIRRHWGTDRDTWMFNSAGNDPMSGDLVYIRFPDGEVITRKPDFVSVSKDYDYETAAWWKAPDLARKIANTIGDIRIRFTGTHGSKDFTINTEVMQALRTQFMTQCIR